MKIRVFLASLAATSLVAGCAAPPRSAQEELDRAAEALRALPGVRSVSTVPAEEDPMRSDPDEQPGYQALAVVHHESLPCEIPGRECGAVVKVWPDAEAALADAEHQAAMAAAGPGFGSAISMSAGRVVVFVDPALDAADAEAILEAVRSLR